MNYAWASNKEKMQRAIGAFAGTENVTEKMIYDEYVKIGGLVIESEVPETFSEGTVAVSDEEGTEGEEVNSTDPEEDPSDEPSLEKESAQEDAFDPAREIDATPEVSDEEGTEEAGN